MSGQGKPPPPPSRCPGRRSRGSADGQRRGGGPAIRRPAACSGQQDRRAGVARQFTHARHSAVAGRRRSDQIILVSAPAGSGKTLLLAEWARERATETAWVSLDVDDNDPRRLWSAVTAALLPCRRCSATAVWNGSSRTRTCSRRRTCVDELVDTLDVLDPPVRVVLDDVHELTGPEVLHDLSQLIRRRPAGLRLVLASRSDPPISSHDFGWKGRLHEVRADRLRFTPDDTAAVIRDSGLALTRADIAVLHTRTEGWAAGLRLAVLRASSHRGHGCVPHRVLRGRASVADYLTGEILQG